MEHEQWTDSGRTELVIILVRRDQQLAARSIRSLGDRHQGTSKKPVSTTIWHKPLMAYNSGSFMFCESRSRCLV